jgi:hypothetical protein
MSKDATTRRLLAAGVVGPPLFVAVLLLAGATRAGYDPVRHFGSLLSLGDQGWIQIANFIVTGFLFVAFALGLRRAFASGPGCRWAPILVGGVGVGLVVSGIFSTDPGFGFPPGTPMGSPATTTWLGVLHYVGALLVFGFLGLGGLPTAAFVVARRAQRLGDRRLMAYSLASGIGMIAFFVAAFAVPGTHPGASDFAGLFQRISITIGWTWLTVLALTLMREPERVRAGDVAPAKS